MYVPETYRAPDPSWTLQVMRRHPLALLASSATGALHATHVPVIFRDEQQAGSAGIDGSVLIGHMNRANPHWGSLAEGRPVLLVFSGPGGYVSPSIYGFTPAAPTWDFTTVHVRGTVCPLQGEEATLGVVSATVKALEAEFGNGWDMSESLPYFRRILPGVGAFEIVIESVEAMFKLSQEYDPQIRERIITWFAITEPCGNPWLAELIARVPATPVAGQ
jgi:transcriptional regulator